MPVATSIEFPQADTMRLFGEIHRASQVLGKSLGASLKMAAAYVARSIGASTRLADKYRQFNPVIGSKTTRGRQEYVAIRPYYAQRERRFFAWNDIDAKKSRAVKIGRRGLAKMSWRVLASNTGPVEGDYGNMNIARRNVQRTLNLGGDDPWIKLTNKIYYAEKALQGGPQAVETAVGRAANSMHHEIGRRAAKTMGLT